MRTYDFEIECPIPPAEVFQAMTDFSPKRRVYFPNLSRGRFQVLEQGQNSARVVEGAGPFVNEEHYHWDDGGRIWSVTEHSNVVAPGGVTDIRIQRRSDGGSRITFHLERTFQGPLGMVLFLSTLVNGRKRFFRKTYYRMLSNVLREKRKRPKPAATGG